MKYYKFLYIALIGLMPIGCVTGQDTKETIYPDGAEPGDQPMLFAKGTVSVDGKNTYACMFYTKLNFSTNTGYVYWVSTGFIDNLQQKL